MPRLPKLEVVNLGSSTKILYVDNSYLIQDKKFTFLTGDALAGATSVSIASTIGFHSLTTSSGQIVLIGELGQERSEIQRTSATAAPGGTSVSLLSGEVLRFDHPQDTKIYILDWNRFEPQWASTAGGTKGTMVNYAQTLQPDQQRSIWAENADVRNSGYYFVRFNNAIDSTNSSFSDAVPYDGYLDNTVHEVKRRALEQLNEKIDENLTDDFLNRCLWEARREYHQAPGKRPFRRRFNNDIGNALTGSYRIELPNWVEKPHTAENIYGVRIGTQENMEFIDKKTWDFYWVNKPHSTLELAYTVDSSTSIWVANGRDFGGSVTFQVEGTTIGCTRIVGEQNSFYIRTQGKWNASSGSDAFENASSGLPDKFTVFAEPQGSAYIYFDRLIDTAYVNQNIYLDGYTTIFRFDSDADELDEPDPDIYVPYLMAKIKKKRDPSVNLLEDDNYKLWLVRKQQALDKEYTGTEIRISPSIDHLL